MVAIEIADSRLQTGWVDLSLRLPATEGKVERLCETPDETGKLGNETCLHNKPEDFSLFPAKRRIRR